MSIDNESNDAKVPDTNFGSSHLTPHKSPFKSHIEPLEPCYNSRNGGFNMNVKSLSKALNQKYIKDIDSSAGKVGPYYFIVEPSNLVSLIRISFYIKDAESIVEPLKEKMAFYRSIGRDGVRSSGTQLILECKVNGLDDAEEFAKILEEVGNTLYASNIIQVDSDGNEGTDLGVFRVGTKLVVSNDDAISSLNKTVGARYRKSNQSTPMAFVMGLGSFLLLIPIFIIVRMFEPSFFGLAIFSYPVLVWILRKSLKLFQEKTSPSKMQVFLLLLGYSFIMYVAYCLTMAINISTAIPFFEFSLFSASSWGFFFKLFNSIFLSGGRIILDSQITLVFALAFNYYIVRSLYEGSSAGTKQVKRSIHRVL